MQAQEMAREKQINFRVSEDEAERFEKVASHYGIAVAAMIRMLVKEKLDEIEAKDRRQAATGEDDFRWDDTHTHILEIVDGERDPVVAGDIGVALCNSPYFYDARFAGTSLALNQLRRNGYLRRLKTGYVITVKGQDAIK